MYFIMCYLDKFDNLHFIYFSSANFQIPNPEFQQSGMCSTRNSFFIMFLVFFCCLFDSFSLSLSLSFFFSYFIQNRTWNIWMRTTVKSVQYPVNLTLYLTLHFFVFVKKWNKKQHHHLLPMAISIEFTQRLVINTKAHVTLSFSIECDRI